MSGKHIIVIPDAHAHPDYDNGRFDVLGDYINRHRPDIVVSIGDWADMASICEHSSKLSLEGKRYKADCASVVDAQHRMFAQVSTRRSAGRSTPSAPTSTSRAGTSSTTFRPASAAAPSRGSRRRAPSSARTTSLAFRDTATSSGTIRRRPPAVSASTASA
jgi:hypothetical protein